MVNKKTIQLQDELDNLYAKSKNNSSFKNLMDLICSEENIMLAYTKIKSNSGAHTPGVDNRTIKDVNKISKQNLIRMARYKLSYYKPNMVKRIYIPKPNGKMRPLGIPTIMDRIVQQCILQVLEPICEAKFYKSSYGFRPMRSAQNAVADLYRKVQKQNLHYVVDVDIKGFFDNVDHNKLIKQMWAMGIKDKKLLMIIKSMLKAEILDEDGTVIKPTKGTPQGGVLSPLLSNIVLNELDWWIASQWEEFPTQHDYQGFKHKNGVRSKNPKYAALRKNSKLKEMYIIRYADDFKIVCKDYETAKKIKIATIDWLDKRLKLEVSLEKTKITNLRRNYSDFLGIQIKVKQKNNKYVVKSRIRPKSLEAMKNKLKDKLKDISIVDTRNRNFEIALYNSMVLGMHNYYEMATDVSISLQKVGYSIRRTLKDRKPFNVELKKPKEITKGDLVDWVPERYRKSKQLRYLNQKAIYPIGCCKNKPPMCSKNLSIYVPEDREAMDIKNMELNVEWVIRTYIPYRSVEYNANRVSRYKAQKGICPITKSELIPTNMHCHHIIPKYLGGDDSYNNLIVIHEYAHKLVHATNQATIDKYVALYPNLNYKKLNELRVKAGNFAIPKK